MAAKLLPRQQVLVNNAGGRQVISERLGVLQAWESWGPLPTLKSSLSPNHALNWKMIPSKWFSVALKTEGLCFHCWKHLYNLPPAAAICPPPLMRCAERQPRCQSGWSGHCRENQFTWCPACTRGEILARRRPRHGCPATQRIAILHVHLKKTTQPNESMVRNYPQTDAHCRFDE